MECLVGVCCCRGLFASTKIIVNQWSHQSCTIQRSTEIGMAAVVQVENSDTFAGCACMSPDKYYVRNETCFTNDECQETPGE